MSLEVPLQGPAIEPRGLWATARLTTGARLRRRWSNACACWRAAVRGISMEPADVRLSGPGEELP